MNIVAPVSSIREVEMLLELGANELYCGVQTPEWQFITKGILWMNRRHPGSANIRSLEELKEIVSMAHQQSVPVSVTLNAPFYSVAGMDYILSFTKKLIYETQIDGLILADVNLIMSIRSQNLPIRLILSSLGNCFNSYAANFFASIGISRIILPRQLKFSEIQSLVRNSPSEVEFEVFGINDGCCFEEGFCQTSHSLGPFCMTDWEIETTSLTKTNYLDPILEWKQYLWYQNNCGSTFQKNGFPNGPCSLCLFSDFIELNISSVKIVGREASFFRKMRSLQLVKTVMNAARSGASHQEISTLARSLRDTSHLCDSGYMCYYRQ